MASSIRSPRASSPDLTRATSRCSDTIRGRSIRVEDRSRPRASASTCNRATSPSAATLHRSMTIFGSRTAAQPTAKAVNAFTKQAYKLLKGHPVNRARVAKGEPPANIVVLRGAGIYPSLVPITERMHLTAAGIAGVALIRGMFRTVGIDPIDVPGATGGLDTDMIAKADAALEALKTYDLVVLHVKATDLCGHDGKASEKIRVIERMDTMMGHLKSKLSSDVVVAITADHSTPVAVKDHSGDPVPLTIFGEGVRVDGVLNFDE